MQSFRTRLVLALAGTMADNLVLSDEAADRAAYDTALALLREICRCALDPAYTDAEALEKVRALSREAAAALRAQGVI